jgi:hypothetical protein
MTGEDDGDGPVDDGRRSPAAPPAFGPEDGLKGRRGRGIDALLREPTQARAAVVAGVSERTLRRWGREPAFRAALLRARRDAFGQAVGLTQRYAPVAVACLVKVMNDPSAGASAKVAAAAVLLRFGREGVELDDLGERVERLEERAAAPARAIVSRTVEPAADDDDEPDERNDLDDEDEPGDDEAAVDDAAAGDEPEVDRPGGDAADDAAEDGT